MFDTQETPESIPAKETPADMSEGETQLVNGEPVTLEDNAERVARERAEEAALAAELETARHFSFVTPSGQKVIIVNTLQPAQKVSEYLQKTAPAGWEESAALLQGAQESIEEQVREFTEQPDMDIITAVFPDAKKWALEESKHNALYTMFTLNEVFYYADILPDYLKENGLDNSLSVFAMYTQDENGKAAPTPFEVFLDCQQERESEQTRPEPLEIMAHTAKDFGFPLDRVNDKIWSFKEVGPDEKLKLDISTKPGNKKNPHFSYSIDFSTVESDVPFVGRLTTFDKRVCIAFGALIDAGNYYFSIDQLFRAMGNTRNPTQKEKDSINNSLTKMSAQTHIDNLAEVAAGFHYEKFTYNGPFLAFERVTGVRINGKESDTVIHAFRYPFVLKLAAERKQLQRVPMPVFLSDINRSDFVMDIEDYLTGRISDAKRGRGPEKVLYSTMYKKLKIDKDDRKAKTRMRKYTERFLEHCKKINWIKDYLIEKDGVTITP